MINYFKTFNFRLFFILTSIFIFSTVIGTITHELGHYFSARLLGYEAKINYRSANYLNDNIYEYLKETSKKYSYKLKNNIDFPEKEYYLITIRKEELNSFLFTIGGPIQTLITGTLGFVLLISFRDKLIFQNKVTIKAWILIFISLFWLRPIFNTITGFINYLIFKKFPATNDEAKINAYLNLKPFTLEFLTSAIGFFILYFIIVLIPIKMRFTFMMSGLVGGLLGFYIWFYKIGKIILP